MNLNLAALFASTHLFAFSAPVALDKADVAKIVRSAAEGLGCGIVSVEFEPRNDEITSYVRRVVSPAGRGERAVSEYGLYVTYGPRAAWPRLGKILVVCGTTALPLAPPRQQPGALAGADA